MKLYMNYLKYLKYLYLKIEIFVVIFNSTFPLKRTSTFYHFNLQILNRKIFCITFECNLE